MRTSSPTLKCVGVFKIMDVESLTTFISRSSSKRSFNGDEEAKEVFQEIVKECVDQSWTSKNTDEVKLTVFRCLRLLLRDANMLKQLKTTQIIPTLCEGYISLTQEYLRRTSYEDSQSLINIMTELTNIVQKLSSQSSLHETLIEHDCHCQMMSLLTCNNQLVFQSSLMALINLCKIETGREAVTDLCPLYTVMDIIASYDEQSRLLAGDLFILLSLDHSSRQQIKDFDLLPNCITLIQSNNAENVKQKIFKALQKILIDEELLEEFCVHGGVPIVVKEVSTRDRSHHAGYLHSTLQLLCTMCVYDPCAKQIVECNGVYHIACHLVGGTSDREQQKKLNANVLRTLRYLFSLESNRRLLKRLFPTHIFEAFIDVGHYKYSLDSYSHLCTMLESLTEDQTETLQTNISSLDKTKEPIGSIGGYLLLEMLGAGAYGIVYRVSKGQFGSFFALKEITATHPALGGVKTQQEKAEKTQRIISEVAMTQKNLSHPNVVRFYKCFQESQNIYIVMNLIDGASLSEYITSLKEKKQMFSESRIWNIFTQIILGLRYLHEEKKIVHRDLKPANLMLGEKDKVTITDFGLAKEHNEFSLLKSIVGTMQYWCPELVQDEPYNKKADIWATGCILYEMAVLAPPFGSSNMLTLAKKISESDYDRTPLQLYSSLLGEVVEKCLCLDPVQRPDSIQVGSLITAHIMDCLDTALINCASMERKLSREREKSAKQKQEVLSSDSRQSSSKRRLTYSSRQSSTVSISKTSSPFLMEQRRIEEDVFDTEPSTPSTHYLLHTDSMSVESTPLKILTSDDREGYDSAIRRSSYSASPISAKRTSRSSLVSISNSQLTEIVDPIEPLMTQVHKLVHISQLPPTPKPSSCHLVVLQYKKYLFAENIQSASFKSEIQKLSSSLNQPITSFPPSPRLLSQAIVELRSSVASNYAGSVESSVGGVLTYELLHAFIEDILQSTNYYKGDNNTCPSH